MPFDAVVSIGGQSFLDGIWRLFGPALQGLASPIPIALPGFANAHMRIRQLVPVVPGGPSAAGGLTVRADIEITGEVLLHVLVESTTVRIAVGSPTFVLADLAGPVALPKQEGTLSDIELRGTIGVAVAALDRGTGKFTLPLSTASLSEGTGTGTLTLVDGLRVPGIPFPAVVPVAVDLTKGSLHELQATLALSVGAPSIRGGMIFTVESVTGDSGAGLISIDALGAALDKAVLQIVDQLGISGVIDQPALDPPVLDGEVIQRLVSDIPRIVGEAFQSAIANLLAATGRLIYPPAGEGASCDSKMLPTSVRARLVADNGGYVLQTGFARSEDDSADDLPDVDGPIECELRLGNRFLLELLCCLVERLPTFSLPTPATIGTTDGAGRRHTRCCNFTNVSAAFGGVVLAGGDLSICIDGRRKGPKRFSLVGSFDQRARLGVPLAFGWNVPLGDIRILVDFTLPLVFDLDDSTSLANLRFLGSPDMEVDVRPNMTGAVIAIAVSSILVALLSVVTVLLAPIGVTLAPLMASAVVVLLLLLVHGACRVARRLLRNAVRALLSGASLLRSPVALPPGLFEAFGRLAVGRVTIDDLLATGVLHTPTSLWGVLPLSGSATSLVDLSQLNLRHIREANEGSAPSISPIVVPVTPDVPLEHSTLTNE
jgi:hypothetical protein